MEFYSCVEDQVMLPSLIIKRKYFMSIKYVQINYPKLQTLDTCPHCQETLTILTNKWAVICEEKYKGLRELIAKIASPDLATAGEQGCYVREDLKAK